MYAFFERDFLGPRHTLPTFHGRPVSAPRHGDPDGKNGTFWHVTSETQDNGKLDFDNRTPCFRRCERVSWIRRLIEEADTDRVHAWLVVMPWKEKRWTLALPDYSYVVVLSDRGEYCTLITAFCVERPHRREKLREQHLVAKAAMLTRTPPSAEMQSPRRVTSTGTMPTVGNTTALSNKTTPKSSKPPPDGSGSGTPSTPGG